MNKWTGTRMDKQPNKGTSKQVNERIPSKSGSAPCFFRTPALDSSARRPR